MSPEFTTEDFKFPEEDITSSNQHYTSSSSSTPSAWLLQRQQKHEVSQAETNLNNNKDANPSTWTFGGSSSSQQNNNNNNNDDYHQSSSFSSFFGGANNKNPNYFKDNSQQQQEEYDPFKDYLNELKEQERQRTSNIFYLTDKQLIVLFVIVFVAGLFCIRIFFSESGLDSQYRSWSAKLRKENELLKEQKFAQFLDAEARNYREMMKMNKTRFFENPSDFIDWMRRRHPKIQRDLLVKQVNSAANHYLFGPGSTKTGMAYYSPGTGAKRKAEIAKDQISSSSSSPTRMMYRQQGFFENQERYNQEMAQQQEYLRQEQLKQAKMQNMNFVQKGIFKVSNFFGFGGGHHTNHGSSSSSSMISANAFSHLHGEDKERAMMMMNATAANYNSFDHSSSPRNNNANQIYGNSFFSPTGHIRNDDKFYDKDLEKEVNDRLDNNNPRLARINARYDEILARKMAEFEQEKADREEALKKTGRFVTEDEKKEQEEKDEKRRKELQKEANEEADQGLEGSPTNFMIAGGRMMNRHNDSNTHQQMPDSGWPHRNTHHYYQHNSRNTNGFDNYNWSVNNNQNQNGMLWGRGFDAVRHIHEYNQNNNPWNNNNNNSNHNNNNGWGQQNNSNNNNGWNNTSRTSNNTNNNRNNNNNNTNSSSWSMGGNNNNSNNQQPAGRGTANTSMSSGTGFVNGNTRVNMNNVGSNNNNNNSHSTPPPTTFDISPATGQRNNNNNNNNAGGPMSRQQMDMEILKRERELGRKMNVKERLDFRAQLSGKDKQ